MHSRQHKADDAGRHPCALCRYIEPLFGETDQPDLPDHIDYEDDASAYIPEAFAYVIGRAIEELMKTVQT
jgi:hypothetical protein